MSRFLHTMVRVKNLDESVRFYTEVLGMKELRRSNNETGKYTLAFVGYGEPGGGEVELTYNWGKDDNYEIGTGFGHLAVAVPDKVRAKGGKVTREAGPVKGGTTVIAFVEDPDGYKIELIQRS